MEIDVRSTETERDEWRDKMTAPECLKHLCLSEELSDVTFTFGSHPNEKLPAHKFVLSMRSAVFHAMFYGSLAESGNTIKVEDIEPETMKEILRYVYCDSPNLNENNAFSCLYAAKKYALIGFERRVCWFLDDNITTDNVCSFHEQSVFYDIQNLQKKCFTFILDNASSVFESNGFLQLSQTTLLTLLQSDSLDIAEKEVFKFCLKWSEQQCKDKNISPTTENQRRVLGDAIFQIRFSSLTVKRFAQLVTPTEILTSDEQVMIYHYLATKDTEMQDKRFNFGRRRRCPTPLFTYKSESE